MVVGVKLSHGDLFSRAEGHRQTVAGIVFEFELAQYQSRSHKVLRLAVMRSAAIVGCIVFNLWPEDFADPVLRYCVPDYRPSQLGGVPGG